MFNIITNNCKQKNKDNIYKFYPIDIKSNIETKIILNLDRDETTFIVKSMNDMSILFDNKIINVNREKKIKTSCKKITIKINKFDKTNNKIIIYFLENIKIDKKYNNLNMTINKYPLLFHKYLMNISSPNGQIKYLNIINNIRKEIKFFLHIHCFNLEFLIEYFDDMIMDYFNLFNIVITYSQGEIISKYKNITWLKIINKGADIGGKICMINYLQVNLIEYEYVLFVHSKTDPIDRLNYLKPFKARAELIINLMSDGVTKIDAIFPNYHNIIYNDITNVHTIKHNLKYLSEFLSWLEIDYNSNKTNWFNSTNTFLFSKKIIDFVFGSDKILIIYNILNHSNTFDYYWYIKKYNIKEKDMIKVYEHYLSSKNIGNCFNDLTKSLPNCCVEHMFERAWINIIKHLNLNYICLPIDKIFDFYKIKLNAIYFPQFHNSPENNKFWGEGFTEWTLLKPYPDKITIRGNEIDILKPHQDIGYYSLDNIEIFKKQSTMAKSYGLNGFVIYHYWFSNSHSVLNVVEKHILTGQIDIPFCFSWANEPWTKRWDGMNNDVMIKQNYEDFNDLTHIEYLVQFFKLPNYMRNLSGECLFYIYNFSHIADRFNQIKLKWENYLSQYDLKIKFISTENALKSNKKLGTEIRFDFLPMSATNTWTSNSNSMIIMGDQINITKQHFEIDYTYLIDKFNLTRNADEYHLGIPISWNNIIRRNGTSHLQINNFNETNLEKMCLRAISKIILKYINKFEVNKINKYTVIKIDLDETKYNFDDNIIIINAWNEWNEQAVLEPTEINGYMVLEKIDKISKI